MMDTSKDFWEGITMTPKLAQKIKNFKIETTVEAFVAALKLGLKPEKKSSIPVLAMAKITGNRIDVTDLDQWSIVEFNAAMPDLKGNEKPFLVPYHAAMDVLKGESGPLTITPMDNSWVQFKVSGCEYKLTSLSTANFPQCPDEFDTPIHLTGDAFRTLVDRTLFAISSEQSRYALHAALIVPATDKLSMVGTDGHRIALNTVPYEGAKAEEFLIRRDTLDMLRTRVNGHIEIGLKNEWQMFRTAGAKFFSRKLSGQFPNYEAVMPRNYKIKGVIDSAAKLHPILARVAKCADERSGAVTFKFGPELVMTASSSERGEAKATFPCVTNDVLTIGMNSEYLLEFLKKVGDRPVAVELKAPESSILFRADDEAKGETFSYVVMPMRL